MFPTYEMQLRQGYPPSILSLPTSPHDAALGHTADQRITCQDGGFSRVGAAAQAASGEYWSSATPSLPRSSSAWLRLETAVVASCWSKRPLEWASRGCSRSRATSPVRPACKWPADREPG